MQFLYKMFIHQIPCWYLEGLYKLFEYPLKFFCTLKKDQREKFWYFELIDMSYFLKLSFWNLGMSKSVIFWRKRLRLSSRNVCFFVLFMKRNKKLFQNHVIGMNFFIGIKWIKSGIITNKSSKELCQVTYFFTVLYLHFFILTITKTLYKI